MALLVPFERHEPQGGSAGQGHRHETPVKVQGGESARRAARERVDGAGGARHRSSSRQRPARRLIFWRHNEQPRDVTFDAGKKHAPELKDGKARLVMEAVSNDLARAHRQRRAPK